MPKRVTLYLDTSVPSALFRGPKVRSEITDLLFREVLPQYQVFVSETVLRELRAIPDPELRRWILQKVRGLRVLPESADARNLATEYLRYLKMPFADALHIAISTVEGMNFLVTWNQKHLAKERTRRIIDNINYLLKLPRLAIVTPEDFFD